MVKKAINQPETFIKEVKKIGFSASKIFYDKGNGTCPRYWNILFDGVTVEDTWQHRNRRLVKSGSDAHEDLQSEFLANLPGVEIEKELWHKNPNLHGFVDAYLPETNTPIEVKTTGKENFEWRQSKMVGTLSNERQLLLYMFLLNADFGLLVYEDRDSLENLIVPVRMTPENKALMQAAFDWMLQVQQVYESGETIKEFSGKRVNSVICNGCEVKEHCEDVFPKGTVDLPLLSKVLKVKE